jgi:hypothetical protein
MRKTSVTFLLLALLMPPLHALAASPNPADYTITAHVRSSEIPSGSGAQRVEAVIDGKNYLLLRSAAAVLRVGDYKARVVDDKSLRAEEYNRTYEFIFQDGKTAKFYVIGESE